MELLTSHNPNPPPLVGEPQIHLDQMLLLANLLFYLLGGVGVGSEGKMERLARELFVSTDNAKD
jgi:hypothetical protein